MLYLYTEVRKSIKFHVLHIRQKFVLSSFANEENIVSRGRILNRMRFENSKLWWMMPEVHLGRPGCCALRASGDGVLPVNIDHPHDSFYLQICFRFSPNWQIHSGVGVKCFAGQC